MRHIPRRNSDARLCAHRGALVSDAAPPSLLADAGGAGSTLQPPSSATGAAAAEQARQEALAKANE